MPGPDHPRSKPVFEGLPPQLPPSAGGHTLVEQDSEAAGTRVPLTLSGSHPMTERTLPPACRRIPSSSAPDASLHMPERPPALLCLVAMTPMSGRRRRAGNSQSRRPRGKKCAVSRCPPPECPPTASWSPLPAPPAACLPGSQASLPPHCCAARTPIPPALPAADPFCLQARPCPAASRSSRTSE